MLYELNALIGAHVIASDGRIGCIRTFLFDESTWTVCSIVADAGHHWMGRQEVVLPVTAIDEADWLTRAFRFGLTRQQVRESPAIDAGKPVPLQEYGALREYFQGFPCWDGEAAGWYGEPDGAEGAAEGALLHSTWELLGFAVHSPEGEIGRAQGLVVHEASWHIAFLDVQTAPCLGERSVLVPAPWVTAVAWGERRVCLQPARFPRRPAGDLAGQAAGQLPELQPMIR